MEVETAKQQHDASSAAKAEALNDWLPITKSRHAKWWYSAFHNVTAMVGAGILGLPYAMSQLGWFVSNLLLNFCKKNRKITEEID
ncbi:hypothetical protein HRI_004622000 [Hibiscus trionum]|uniref:Amino acid transporter transmembrane domain-containing protein n=1 Tax=Hibiscus trionum TaxID=183268 RepID=A0A9W7J7G0_HIBTR|nr:hypothetical protein HRI_004622000 [Hibiscus trionum]